MDIGISEHTGYSAVCSQCGRPFAEADRAIFFESIEAFIYRLSKHNWFADHKYAFCPRCWGKNDLS